MKKIIQLKLKENVFRKISYDEISESSNLSKNTINNIVNGKNFNPTLDTLNKLSYSSGQDCVKLCQNKCDFRNTEVRKIIQYIFLNRLSHAENSLNELRKKTRHLKKLDNSLSYVVKYNERYIKLLSFYLNFLQDDSFELQKFEEAFMSLYLYDFDDPLKITGNYFTREEIYFACLLLHRKKHYEKSIAILNSIIDSNIKDYNYLTSLITLSMVYMELGELEKSIKLCDEGVEICIELDYAFDLAEIFKIRDYCLMYSGLYTDRSFYDSKRFKKVDLKSTTKI
ncbi:MAG: helix-turn-helix transcriptional regulator [Lagierella massiliensis]|nr:helix-turn-helix transcriptional regulator [Lagierella massiliensis]